MLGVWYFLRSRIRGLMMLFITAVESAVSVIGSFFLPMPWFADFMLRTYGRHIVWAMNVKIRAEGLENIPDEGVLFVFNHSSHLDIPVIHKTILKSFRFGAKEELFKIPIFGWAMRRFGALKISRSQRDRVLKIYQQSVARVRSGESFILAPEGTRQEGHELGRFKSGPFIFAVSGQFKVVPIVLYGVHKVLPKGKLFPDGKRWSYPVRLKVLPPISAAGYGEEEWPILLERVKAAMEQVYDQMKKEEAH